jgi:N utilization substance protein B
MISRRLIRIKVLQVLYAYSKKNAGYSSQLAEKELFHSIEKFYDLYHLLLLLISEIVDLEQKKIELRLVKKSRQQTICFQHQVNRKPGD